MGTMAAFYSGHPGDGGRLIGTVGLDGHPDRMLRIARAGSRKAFRAAVRAVRAEAGRAWWDPKRIWWTWPSNGLVVHDYSYWWDEGRGTAMVANYQFGPVALDADVARDHERWPQGAREDPNPDLVGVPVPEFFATVDPWDPPDVPLHCRTSADRDEAAAERLFSADGDEDVVLERLPGGVGARSDDAVFRARRGTAEAEARGAAAAAAALARRRSGVLGPEERAAYGAWFLYSVEDFLRECRFGAVRVARRDGGRLFTVDADHPLAGAIRTEDDTLAKALVLARRRLLAAPGFRLRGVPPFGRRHVGSDPA